MNLAVSAVGTAAALDPLSLPAEGFASHALSSAGPLLVRGEPGGFTVEAAGRQTARVGYSAADPGLSFDFEADAASPVVIVVAVLEALFTCNPSLPSLKINLEAGAVRDELLAQGAVEAQADGFISRPELLFQLPAPFLGKAPPVYPEVASFRNGVHHPQRPPKPSGTVYQRTNPWLGRALTFHVADPDRDLEVFNKWMNDPRVAAIWQDQGDLAFHRRFLSDRLADPRTLPLIGSFGGTPFGYFELYWAKEDRLGPHYDADAYDRGWHVAIGEEVFRGKAFVSAWLPSLMHYMFLADPRTRRIVGEPVHDHQQQIRNLDRSGFAKVKHVTFAHKRALLVMLLRERFFLDRLLFPDLSGSADAPIGSLPRKSV
ncbi:siderophore biosynthesis protein [Sinorhizobium glycinis]|uniref:Siderophore biosynthesis protein n=1 Tax=Sinorhizobium glycinis TaxID=1472378 RepID=A0A178XME3_9HYPH|nr:GNAT family N-acetyltransferase [Sinorhizobium glycinis]OAP36418.1 siderophore biosynthesis protein [Sinorhizobium glycinis]